MEALESHLFCQVGLKMLALALLCLAWCLSRTEGKSTTIESVAPFLVSDATLDADLVVWHPKGQ